MRTFHPSPQGVYNQVIHLTNIYSGTSLCQTLLWALGITANITSLVYELRVKWERRACYFSNSISSQTVIDLLSVAGYFKGGYFPVQMAWGIRLLNGVTQVSEKGKEAGRPVPAVGH